MARFYGGYKWRWVVLAIDDPSVPALRIVTFLDTLALDAAVDRVLNDPMVITLRVPSDSPEVYLLDGDGDPHVAEGTRAVVGMRAENPSAGVVWVPRAAGMLLQPRDAADVASGAGNAYSSLSFYDGWQTLYRRPVTHFNGDPPDPDNPLRFIAGEPADNVALDLLFNTEAAHGPVLIDSSALPGNALPGIPETLEYDREMTVGQAWKQLCDSNLMDIVLDPVLDLGGGYLWSLRIEERIGEARYDAVFAWDTPGRSLASFDRLEDGAVRVNKLRGFNGQAIPITGAESVLTDAASVVKYGESWLVKAYPETADGGAALLLAQDELDTRKNGVTTISISPTPERSAVPFIGYDIGDSVPVTASGSHMRMRAENLWRVTKIPVRMAASGPEVVEQLEVTSDEDPPT